MYEIYIKKLSEKLSKNFDIHNNYEFDNLIFDLFAKSSIRNEKYFATKKTIIYAFENNELCFVKYSENFDNENYNEYINKLKNYIKNQIDPDTEHMSTMITGIIVVDKIYNRNLINKIRKFKYHKGFAFGFKGWLDMRLILVELEEEKVFGSKKAKKVEKFYQP